MKNSLLLISLLIIFCLSANSQSRTGRYLFITTDHYSAKDYPKRSTSMTKYTEGNIKVDVPGKTIIIDNTTYAIVHSEKPELADENWKTQVLTVTYLNITKSGKQSYKVIDVVLSYRPDGAMDEVTFKKTKTTMVTYKFSG